MQKRKIEKKKAMQVRESSVPTLWIKAARVILQFCRQAYWYKKVRAYSDRLGQGLSGESIDLVLKKM